uniref:MARVEL domain-containing protein n=1 Tax=Panagrellus redivivus TaxID=6233 RepID=A0A7E4ZUM1_PANRE
MCLRYWHGASNATKATMIVMIIYPFAPMIAYPLAAWAFDTNLLTMGAILMFWSLIPSIILLGMLIYSLHYVYKHTSSINDTTQLLSLCGLISLSFFHVYSIIVSATMWAKNIGGCWHNTRNCVDCVLLFELVGLTWIVIMVAGYQALFKRLFH